MTISATSQGLRPGVCVSTARPATPFDGQVIYETDTNTLAVYDGSGWVSLNPVDRDRNVIINGAMQIAQRGTSTASITSNSTTSYFGPDRFATPISSMGTWTQSQETDAPTGSGLRNSLKMLCTTAQASPSAGAYLQVDQRIEGFNCQKFAKGTSSATQITLSFWVKTSSTGTFVVSLEDANNRYIASTYSVSSAGSWEKKTITFPGDTSGTLANSNAQALKLLWWLASGTTYTSGTLQTSWGANSTAANLAAGQTNLAAATNNYWQITGVQLEAGAVATPFEFEDYGTTLAKCQRYYWRASAENNFGTFGIGLAKSTTQAIYHIPLPVKMRARATAVETSGTRQVFDGNTVTNITAVTVNNDLNSTTDAMSFTITVASGLTQFRPYVLSAGSDSTAYIAVSAEL